MSSLHLFTSRVKQCDIFGKKPRFTVQREKTFKTLFGSIVSLITMCIILFFIWFFGKEIYLREQPSLVTTLINDESPKLLLLNKTNYEFTIGLQNPDYSLYIDESIYTINVTSITVLREINGTTKVREEPLPMIKCSDYPFTILPDYFEYLELHNLYCFNYTNSLRLIGEFGKAEWSYLSFDFYKCENSSMNNNSCMSEDEINSRLTGGYLGIFSSDLLISPNNYSTPQQKFGKNIFSTFSIMDSREVWMYLNNIEVNTDQGLIFNTYTNSQFFSFDSIRETTAYRNEKSFVSLKMRLATTRQIFDRSYMKIQTFAAYVGGIIKFALIVAEMIVYWFKEILFRHYILSFYGEEKLDKKQYSIPSQNNLLTESKKKRHEFQSVVQHNNRTKIKLQTVFTTLTLNHKYHIHPNSTIIGNNANNTNNNNISKSQDKICNQTIIKRSKTVLYLNSLSFCICKKKSKKELLHVLHRFDGLAISFDIVHYLKCLNDLFIIKTKLLNNAQLKVNEIGYNFEQGNLGDIYDHIIQYPKQKANSHIQGILKEMYQENFKLLFMENDQSFMNDIIINSGKTIGEYIP